MASFLNEHGWRPPWAYPGRPYSALIVKSRTGGVSISWNPPGPEPPDRHVGEFLAARLRSLNESDLSSEANFLYVVLRCAPGPGERSDLIGGETSIAEFGFGAPPSSPEDWPLLTLRTLLQASVSFLLGRDGAGR
jgi:hypothetical protein